MVNTEIETILRLYTLSKNLFLASLYVPLIYQFQRQQNENILILMTTAASFHRHIHLSDLYKK